jgi:hypothetical protein
VLDDSLPEDLCRLQIANVRSSVLLCYMTDRYDNMSFSSKLGIATSAGFWMLAVPVVDVIQSVRCLRVRGVSTYEAGKIYRDTDRTRLVT